MEPVDLNLGALGLNMDKIGGLLPGKTQRFHGWTVENQLFLKKLGFQRTKNAVEPLMLIVKRQRELARNCKILAPTGHLEPTESFQNQSPVTLIFMHQIDVSAAKSQTMDFGVPSCWSIVCGHIQSCKPCFIMFYHVSFVTRTIPKDHVLGMGWTHPKKHHLPTGYGYGFDSGPFACMLTDGLPQVGCIGMGNHGDHKSHGDSATSADFPKNSWFCET